MHAWRDILRLSAEYLVQKGVPDAQVAAELLVARLLKCGRGFLSPRLDETPDPKYVEAMRRGIARLAAGEPVQYVLGEWDFRSLTLKCDRRALIPRQDTEVLVETVLNDTGGLKGLTLLDLCTGTGCIALALKRLGGFSSVTGSDLSEDALSLARENAAALGEDVRFVRADLFRRLAEERESGAAEAARERKTSRQVFVTDFPGVYDVITANPPYIRSGDIEALMPEVRSFEPVSALDGAPDGLSFYRRLAAECPAHLVPGGRLYLEIGCWQAADVAGLLEKQFTEIRVIRDLSGLDRVVAARRKPEDAAV